MKIAVMGSGGWGTALALVLLENGHDVTLWSYTEAESAVLRERRENPMLKGVPLPEGLKLTSDPACASGCGAVVLATPSFAVRTTARTLAPLLEPGAVLVSGSKGIEKDTSLTLTESIAQEVGEGHPIGALSGPSHAEEVGRGVPTVVVSASKDKTAAELVQDLFMNERFRVYASDDVVGVELGAALKNVIALCAGICDGMGFGDNTKAALMTRGLTEIARLGVALGGRRETFAGLSGVGSEMCIRDRRGGSDCHLHLHALPQPPLRHPDRPGHAGGRGGEGDRRGGGGLLCRRHGQGIGRQDRGGDAHHRGGLPGALSGQEAQGRHQGADDPGA